MLVGLAIGIGIPALLIGVYVWGRYAYGEQWYVVLGQNAARGDDDLSAEIEGAQITSLNLARADDPKREGGEFTS